MERHSIAVILPAHNEEIAIEGMLTSLDSILENARIVVVDNASSDNTRAIASLKLSRLKRNEGTLLVEHVKGKSIAIARALRAIEADVYVMCDADATYVIEDLHKLVSAVQDEGFEMAVADRHSSGAYRSQNNRRFHDVGNKAISRIINWIYKSNLKDVLSGFRALSRDFVNSYPHTVKGFELETDLTLHALDKNMSIKEVPSGYRQRPSGSYSKLNTYSDGIRILRLIARLIRYYKPILFFNIGGLILVCLSLLVGSIPIRDFIMYNYVFHLPLAVLASGLFILGITFCLVGIILDSIRDANMRIYSFARGRTGNRK